ncbi:MAG: phosphoglucosamine mutase, partial [Gammaproteobacteria bacterium]|nr:phosphoglucosamine mutase [Gammaproteobacteria bacterium]
AAIALPMQTVESEKLGKARRIDNADARYIEACKASVSPDLSLSGLKMVVDCAHGAAYHIAPKVFSELGADVIAIGVEPDGLNINLGCGATSLDALQQQVVEHQADLGIALDGDADRIMMVDHTGAVVDGDQIIYMIARSRLVTDSMEGPVVGTLMSNLGLELAIQDMGLTFIREGVGDRHIMRRLIKDKGILGGEPSGHIICLDKTTTGDGIVAALQVLQAMVVSGDSLASLRQGMSCYPQTMVNVPVSAIMNADQLASVQGLVEDAERDLGDSGRILLRPSGTEPVVRVMVEGKDAQQVGIIANQLADRVSAAL